jgi:hypothetical protein
MLEGAREMKGRERKRESMREREREREREKNKDWKATLKIYCLPHKKKLYFQHSIYLYNLRLKLLPPFLYKGFL